jgi:hypothetical protein
VQRHAFSFGAVFGFGLAAGFLACEELPTGSLGPGFQLFLRTGFLESALDFGFVLFDFDCSALFFSSS